MAEKNVLSVETLCKNYGEKSLFEDITFGIGEGQRVALVAKNGTGKSTLLRILCGTEVADAGTVTFLGSVSWSYLRQEADLDEHSTVLDTLYVGESPAIDALKNYERSLSGRRPRRRRCQGQYQLGRPCKACRSRKTKTRLTG